MTSCLRSDSEIHFTERLAKPARSTPNGISKAPLGAGWTHFREASIMSTLHFVLILRKDMDLFQQEKSHQVGG